MSILYVYVHFILVYFLRPTEHKDTLSLSLFLLQSLQARTNVLYQQRRALQYSLEQRAEGSDYQYVRATLNQQVMGLAALMAGLRTNLSHNREEADKLKASYQAHQHTLEVRGRGTMGVA